MHNCFADIYYYEVEQGSETFLHLSTAKAWPSRGSVKRWRQPLGRGGGV